MSLSSVLSHLHIGGHHGGNDAAAAASNSAGASADPLHCPRRLEGPARLGAGLSSSLPPLPPDQLDYTRRDWERWDTFDLAHHTLAGIKRRTHNLGGGDDDPLLCEPPGQCAVTVPARSAGHAYFHLFRLSVLHVFWSESHHRFRCLQVVKPEQENGCDDWLAQLRKDKQLPVEQIANFMANSLNQEYNYWRIQQRERAAAEIKAAHAQQTSGGTIDATTLDRQVDLLVDSTPFGPRTHAACAPTIAWFNEVVRTHLSFQCLDPHMTLKENSPYGGPWKPLGHWPKGGGADEKVFEQRQHMWRAPGIAVLYGRYLHLLDDGLVRAVRRAMYASLAAQYEWYTRMTPASKKHHLESQWLLRISGFVLHTFVLRRGEEELRARGVWNDERDAVKVTDRTTGAWTHADLIAFSEERLADIHDGMRLFGQTEFLSSYYGYCSDLLGDMQLFPCSQRGYDMAVRMLQRLQWDLAAHLMPASGTFSGPSGRSYDLFGGCHNQTDRVDLQLYYQHCFQPYCHPDQQQCIMRRRSNGTALKADLRMDALLAPVCAAGGNQGRLPTLVPPSGDTDPNWHRLWLAVSQLAGTGSLPFAAIERFPIAQPYRVVEQRFSHVVGQERFNFLTTHVQMGHAGEDAYSLATSLLACARLGGVPAAQTPVAIVNHGETHCNSFVRLFPRVGADPDPCWRASLKGVAGDDRMALSRQIAVQFQGFLLITHLLAPVSNMSAETMAGSWDSNLMLPLSVDALSVDETPLPRAIGTRLRIPPQAIFTARHGAAVVVVRLASFTKEDDIRHSDGVAPVSAAEGAGVSLEWLVDESTASCGCGRIVVHHRRKEEGGAAAAQPPVKPYRVLWLWGSGVAANENETRALQAVLRSAHISERVEASADWSERSQPRDSYPAPWPAHSTAPVGEQRWVAEAHLASGALKLSVSRTDVYCPWSHAPQYREPDSGPLHSKPYYSRDVHRTVNDQPILVWSEGEDAYRVHGLQPAQIFEPHRPGGCTRVFTDLPVTDRPPE